MESELNSIYKNGTWDMMPLPPHRTAISTKWVFRVKTNSDGSIAKLKAQLVAKRFQQREGMDYKETFAPVVKWNTLRTVIALAGHHSWDVYHLDVKTAFLNGTINEDIYVTPAPALLLPTRIWSANSRRHYMGLNKPRVRGTLRWTLT